MYSRVSASAVDLRPAAVARTSVSASVGERCGELKQTAYMRSSFISGRRRHVDRHAFASI